jgi:hypothetical protein
MSVQEDVTEFQITVDDLMCVHPFTCADELNEEDPDLWFCQSFPTSNEIYERL